MPSQQTILNKIAGGRKDWNDWVAGQEKPLDLQGLTLTRKDLRGYDFTQCKLERASFGQAMVHGANFCGATLDYADLSEVEGLTELALKRTYLAHVSLPESFELKGCEEAIKGAQKLQRTHAFILTLGLVYLSGLYQINSEMFFAPKSQLLRLNLPNGWVNLGVSAFIFVTAALLTIFTIYSHLFTYRVRKVWSELPQEFPDGSLRQRVLILEPWVDTLHINEEKHLLPEKNPNLFTWLSILITYLFPIIILILSLMAVIPFHRLYVSGILSSFCILASISFIYLFLRRYPRLKRWHIDFHIICFSCIACTIFFLLSISQTETLLKDITLLILNLSMAMIYLTVRQKIPAYFLPEKDRKHKWSVLLYSKPAASFIFLLLFSLTMHRYLFNFTSMSFSLLQANLTMAQLSEFSRQFDQQGTYQDNQYRVRGIPLSRSNLNGARLDGAFLFKARLNRSEMKGANLSGADLRGASIQNAHLENAQLTDARFDYANLLNTHLQGADFDNSSFVKTVLNSTNLEGAKNTETSKWVQVDAVKANMNGLNLRGASFSTNAQGILLNDATLIDTKFENSNLLGAQFRNAKLKHGTSFKGATLDQVDFTGATAAGVDFRAPSLLKAVQIPKAFSECNFEGFNFLSSTYEDIPFKNCFMARANFDLVAFTKVRFHGSQLFLSSFTGAQLRHASFIQANCQLAELNCADLRFSDFRETDLSCANLSNSDLWGANFRGVKNFDDPDNPLKVQNTLILGIIASDDFIEWALANGATMDYDEWKGRFKKGLGCDFAEWPFDPAVP